MIAEASRLEAHDASIHISGRCVWRLSPLRLPNRSVDMESFFAFDAAPYRTHKRDNKQQGEDQILAV